MTSRCSFLIFLLFLSPFLRSVVYERRERLLRGSLASRLEAARLRPWERMLG